VRSITVIDQNSRPLPRDSTLPYFWITAGAVGVWLILHLNDVVVDMIWYRELQRSLKMYLSNTLRARPYHDERENEVRADRKSLVVPVRGSQQGFRLRRPRWLPIGR
jgi:hypothetical protein